MIGETRSGSSFRGLTHYLLFGSGGDRKTPGWVELRNLATADPATAYPEMEATASQNVRVKEPVFHVVLSPAAGDELTQEQWRALADRVLGDLGLGEHQAVVVLHTDTDHPHLHLAVNRVHPETLRAWDRWKSHTRIEGILRKVEREWGLRVVPGRLAEAERSGREERPPALTYGERARLHHRAEEPQVLAWRRELREAFEGAGSWTELAGRLQVNGVHLVARGRGMVASDGEVYVKLSRLDRAWSRGRLEERFGQPFAEWRKEMRRFEEAGRLYPRYAARGPDHPRARAAVRTLQRVGRNLGWRALRELQGPLSPAVSGVASAARRQARLLDQQREDAWAGFARRYLAPALDRAGSWAEAESRLALYGAWLGPGEGSGRELLVTDGRHVSPVAELGSRWRGERLEERWGAWREWERTRRDLLTTARGYHRLQRPPEPQVDRWRRLAGVIRDSERLVEGYEQLQDRYRDAEWRLERLLRRESGASPEAVARIVRQVRDAPAERVDGLLASLKRRRLPLGRRRPGEATRGAARELREAAARLAGAAPPARSAARRLDRLRRQAWLRDPHRRFHEQRRLLREAVRPLVGAGVRSLLARAAPGLGAALSVVRLVGRLQEELTRDLDRSR